MPFLNGVIPRLTRNSGRSIFIRGSLRIPQKHWTVYPTF
jgi:hypothetical protein